MRRAVVLTVAGAALAVAVALTIGGVGDDPAKLTNWQALVLGLVQGATEFLPISSSGHLILVPWLFDWTYLEQNDAFNQTFDVALHLGTLVAVTAYFWRDVVELLIAPGSARCAVDASRPGRSGSPGSVLVATIPAAVVGFLLEDVIAERLGEPWQIAIFLAALRPSARLRRSASDAAARCTT